MSEQTKIKIECRNKDCSGLYKGKRWIRANWLAKAEVKYPPKTGFGAEITIVKNQVMCPHCGEPGSVVGT